jgi:ABC-2 type transport system permease protein
VKQMIFLTLLKKEVLYFTNFNNKMYQFLLFFQPLVYLTIFYFLLQFRDGIDPGRYVVASALISMWSYVLYSSGSALISQKWSETLKLLMAAPVSLFNIILTKAISNSIIALITMLISFLYAKFIFSFQVQFEHFGVFMMAVIVLLFSLTVIGMILAVVFAAFQNVFSYQNLIHTPIILLCGVFVPVDEMPFIFKYLAYLLPMTWGIKGVYESITMEKGVYTTLVICLFLSLIVLILSKLIVHRMEDVLKNTGKVGAM